MSYGSAMAPFERAMVVSYGNVSLGGFLFIPGLYR